MGYQSFTVGTDPDHTDIKRNVQVFVYDTVEELRVAGSEFRDGEEFPDAMGITHGVVDDPDGLLAAIVRLSATHLGTQVITHEMAHAAQTIYWLDVILPDPDARAFDHFLTNNETFAYVLGDLCSTVVDKLYDLGYYDRVNKDDNN